MRVDVAGGRRLASDEEACREEGATERAAGAYGVFMSVNALCRYLYNHLAYTIAVQHGFTRTAIEEYLKLRSRLSACLTPHRPYAWAESCVDLHTLPVNSCRNGCVAYTGAKKALDKCSFHGFARDRASGTAFKTTKYWPHASWLQAMLADLVVGHGMLRYLERARSATERPVDSARD